MEADELRFVRPPETEVRFTGEPAHESASGSDRANLPEQVEPGVKYRNVRVDYRLASRLVGLERKPPERTAPGRRAHMPSRGSRASETRSADASAVRDRGV